MQQISRFFYEVTSATIEVTLRSAMPKVITVFGATGNQGSSVIKYILADSTLSKEFTIRGVTRDDSEPAAQALSKQGVQLVKVGSAYLLVY